MYIVIQFTAGFGVIGYGDIPRGSLRQRSAAAPRECTVRMGGTLTINRVYENLALQIEYGRSLDSMSSTGSTACSGSTMRRGSTSLTRAPKVTLRTLMSRRSEKRWVGYPSSPLGVYMQ